MPGKASISIIHYHPLMSSITIKYILDEIGLTTKVN